MTIRYPGNVRRIALTTVVVLLVIGLGWGLRWALRKPAARVAAPLAPDAASATSIGDVVWFWSGQRLCQSGKADVTEIFRVGPNGVVAEHVPLLVVSSLATFSERTLIASGRDVDCRPAAYRSTDAGQSWRPLPALAGSASVDAAAGGTVWAVPGEGETVVRVAPSGAVETRPPRCPEPTTPTLISAANADEAWLMCQDELALQRTLLHTADGGVKWDVPANELSNSGLDGVGRVKVIDMHVAGAGWLLKPARRCPEGELRTTSDGGNRWTDLPCPRESIPVADVLTVRFTDREHGLLLGVRGSKAVLARTADGGRSWRLEDT